MRRKVVYALALGLAAGCVGYKGPVETYRENRDRPRADRADAPGYTIEEQEKRARSRFTLFEDDPRVAPPTGIARPGAGVGR